MVASVQTFARNTAVLFLASKMLLFCSKKASFDYGIIFIALAVLKPDTVIKVAPRRVQIVLALEVTTSWWPTNLTDRDTQAYGSTAPAR
jgi:hypothetical protein